MIGGVGGAIFDSSDDFFAVEDPEKNTNTVEEQGFIFGAHPTVDKKRRRFKLAFSVYRAYSARTMQCMRVGRLISQYHFVDMSLKVSIAQPCYRIRHKIARRNYALTHVPGMMPALSLKAIENIIWEFLWRAVPKSKVMKPRANIH